MDPIPTIAANAHGVLRLPYPSQPQTSSQLITCLIITLPILVFYLARIRRSKLPELNPRKPSELTDKRRITHFMQQSIELLSKGRAQFHNKPYKLFSDWGQLIVLPLDVLDDIRSDPRFDFFIAASDVSIATSEQDYIAN